MIQNKNNNVCIPGNLKPTSNMVNYYHVEPIPEMTREEVMKELEEYLANGWERRLISRKTNNKKDTSMENKIIFHGRNKPKQVIINNRIEIQRAPKEFTLGFYYDKAINELLFAWACKHPQDIYDKYVGIKIVKEKLNEGTVMIIKANDIPKKVRDNFQYYYNKALQYFKIEDYVTLTPITCEIKDRS